MNKRVSLCAVVLVAFLAAGCGGSGGGSNVASAPPSVAAKAVPDVTFVNVPTDPLKTAVIPGERAVEVAAFRMSWKDPQSRAPIGQLVFMNQSTDNLWRTFKDFKLVDSNGNDVSNEALYSARRDDVRHEVVIDFYQAAWFPNDFGIVPKTYSLLVSMDPSVAVGTTFAFSLSDVQMHDAGKTVTTEVDGAQFKVISVVGKALPVVTTGSPSYFAVAPNLIGTAIPVGNFKVFCPAEDLEGCTLIAIKGYAQGMYEPVVSISGFSFGSRRGTYPDSTDLFTTNVSYTVPPGQMQMFTLSSTAVAANVFISVIDMIWIVGGQQTRVSPIIPTGPESCGLMVSDGKSCKG